MLCNELIGSVMDRRSVRAASSLYSQRGLLPSTCSGYAGARESGHETSIYRASAVSTDCARVTRAESQRVVRKWNAGTTF